MTKYCTKAELNEALISKADVSDVSKAVSNIIEATAVDHRPELDDIRRQLITKITKQDI
jgi:hypothetical protein